MIFEDENFEKRRVKTIAVQIMSQYRHFLISTCVLFFATIRMLEGATIAQGETLLYEQLLELRIRVVDHMMRAHDALREKVRRTMGGEVLELMRDRAERLDAWNARLANKVFSKASSRVSSKAKSRVSIT